jgi:hypothetical protein
MPWRTSPEWSSLSQSEEHGFKSHPGYCGEGVGGQLHNGLVAQLAEHLSLKQEEVGSIPTGATAWILGVSSKGKTVGLHPVDEGSTPSTVH